MPESQVFAFDFGGSIRAAALAMGGDWHDLGGALSEDVAEPVALQPLARIDDAGERAWAAEWIAALLAREVRRDHARAQGTSLVGADLAQLGSHRGAHDHRPFGPPAVERAEAGASALHDRWSLGPPARRRNGATGRGRRSGVRDRGPHRRGRRAGGPLLSLSPHRGPLRRPADPSHHR